MLRSFGVALVFPTSQVFTLLNLRVGYAPQYVLAYIAGVRDGKLGDSRGRFVRWSFGVGLGAVSVACAAMAVGFASGLQLGMSAVVDAAQGGLNRFAALYTVWNVATGSLIGGLVLDFFKAVTAQFHGQAAQTLARCAYATFLVHTPASVAVEVACHDRWVDWGLGKFFIISIFNVIACWSAGWLLCHMPGVRRFVL